MLPVCVQCQRCFRREESGTVIIETTPSGPYALWFADMFVCPECGAKVTSSTANTPYFRQFDPGFDAAVDRARTYAATVEVSR